MYILDFAKSKVGDGPLYGLKNYYIKRKVNELDTFKFDIPKSNPFYNVVKEEYYFRTDSGLYVINSLKPSENYITVEGKQDVEALENKLWLDGFSCPTSNLLNMAQLAIAGTGWTVQVANTPTYQRTLNLDITNSLDVILKIADKFKVEVVFDSINKVVKFNSKFGNDRGVYFSDQLNATKIYKKSDTKEFATRIVARGKDGLTFASINGGKDYVEDYTYSNKLKTYIWTDARYTVAESLLEDAKAMLSIMCKPLKVYEVDIVDLSALSEYSFLDYDLGDTVTIMNSEYGFKDTQRITELTRYPEEPTRSKVTLANCSLTLEDINKKTEESVEKVDNAFNENGTINGSKVDGIDGSQVAFDSITVDHLTVNSVDTDQIVAGAITGEKIDGGTITAAHLEAGTIKANSGVIDDLAITTAHIAKAAITVAKIEEGFVDKLVVAQGQFDTVHIKEGAIDTAQIHDLAVTVAKVQNAFVDNLVAKQGKFESAHIGVLTSNNIDANTIKASHISGSVIEAINLNVTDKISADRIDAANLKVENIDAGKITTGSLTADRMKANIIAAVNASVENATINSAKISNLDASKITTGSISADVMKTNIITAINASIGKISASHIDADSLVVNNIDAGKITTGDLSAERIQASVIAAINSYTGTAKIKQAQIETLKVGNANIVDLDASKITAGKISSDRIDAETLTVKSANITGEINASKISGGTLDISKIAVSSTSGNLTISDNTIQIKDNQATPKVRVQIGKDSTGKYGILVLNASGQPIFDSDYGVYEPGIKDLAVSKDKIKDGAVDINKLNLDSLFVGDTAFINKLKAVEIDAARITTGKIQGERIDIAGLISFEALDTTLQPLFDVTGNKTYINGGMIATNTIKANSIDLLSGLTVKGPDNTTTFAIASDGNVEVNGLLQSGNYSEEKNTGYRLSTDGKAVLNQALVRGDVVLPNAGMTNAYDMDQVAGRNLFVKSTAVVNKYVTSDGALTDNEEWAYTNFIPVKPGEKYIASGYSNLGISPATCFYNSSKTYVSGIPNNNEVDQATEETMKNDARRLVTIPDGCYYMRFSFMKKDIDGLKIENGIVATEWTPAPEDNLNPVRMWAGTSYELRDQAPFRVMQNGDVYAYNAILTGILYGQVDSGYAKIKDKEISIVDNTKSPAVEYVKFNTDVSVINTDFIVGGDSDNFVTITKSSKDFTVNNGSINFKGALTNVSFDPVYTEYGGLNLTAVISTGRHVLRHSSDATKDGTLVFDSQGNQGLVGDFSFTRKNYQELVKVNIDGTLDVKSSITSSTQNIEIRSVANEGWGYYAS